MFRRCLFGFLGCCVLLTGMPGQAEQEELPRQGQQESHPLLASSRGKAAYGIGVSIGRQLSQEGLETGDLKSLLLGIKDSLEGHPPRLTEAQFEAAMQAMRATAQAKRSQVAAINKKKGLEFLAKNANRPEVTAFPSGLQAEQLKKGAGPTPKATDRVRTHYRGTLIDGTEFDSSYKGGEPVVFGVSDVIAGWTEALQKMQVGARWRLYIPPDLGYGEAGAPPSIGPNSVLIFDLELLAIE